MMVGALFLLKYPAGAALDQLRRLTWASPRAKPEGVSLLSRAVAPVPLQLGHPTLAALFSSGATRATASAHQPGRDLMGMKSKATTTTLVAVAIKGRGALKRAPRRATTSGGPKDKEGRHHQVSVSA